MRLQITLKTSDADALGGELLVDDLGMVRTEGTNDFHTMIVPGILGDDNPEIDFGRAHDDVLDDNLYAKPFLSVLADHGISPVRVKLEERGSSMPVVGSALQAAYADFIEATAEYVEKKSKVKASNSELVEAALAYEKALKELHSKVRWEYNAAEGVFRNNPTSTTLAALNDSCQRLITQQAEVDRLKAAVDSLVKK